MEKTRATDVTSDSTNRSNNMQIPSKTNGREYPERPIVGVGGLIFDNESVLLVKRGKEPGKGKWSIPGGALKVGETLTEGAAREVLEEVGLKVDVGPLVEAVERIFPDEDGRVLYHYVILDFLCIAESNQPEAGSDADDARYVHRCEWVDYGLPASAIRVLEKGLAMSKLNTKK